MRVLITGAKGYVGWYLASYLLTKGYEVTAHTLDLNKTKRLPVCDVIVNCIARKRNDCIYCTSKKTVTIDSLIYSNVTACQNLVRLAKSPIIHLSSVAVYDMNRTYGVTKLLGEHIMREANAVIIRLPRVVDYKTGEGDIVIGLENIGENINEAIWDTCQL